MSEDVQATAYTEAATRGDASGFVPLRLKARPIIEDEEVGQSSLAWSWDGDRTDFQGTKRLFDRFDRLDHVQPDLRGRTRR